MRRITLSLLLILASTIEAQTVSNETEVMLNLLDRVEALEKELNEVKRDSSLARQRSELTQRYLAETHGIYIIVVGDTIGKIAAKYQISAMKIIEMNDGIDPRRIRIGQVIKIKDLENQAAHTTSAYAPPLEDGLIEIGTTKHGGEN